MERLAVSALCAVLLAACETVGGVRPPPVGASILEVEPGRYRVSFRGVSGASDAEIRDRALLQAAELALARGADWFRVVDRYGDIAPPTRPRFTFGLGVGGYGRHSGVDVGASRSVGGEGTFVSTLEIQLGRGARPADPDAYDARAVADTLRRRLG
jgi:hypothetical protein